MGKLHYLLLITWLFAGCYGQQKPETDVAVRPFSKTEKAIDSLLSLERNSELRAIAFEALQKTDAGDNRARSSLYSSISKSYKYSLFFDSAVYYARLAYNLSLKLKDEDIKAERGANLLLVYNMSSIYHDEQEQMLDVLDKIDKKKLSLQVHAHVLYALSGYYEKAQRFEMCLFLPTKGQALYEEYLKNRTPSHEDSAYMARFYINISDAYTFKNYISPSITDDAIAGLSPYHKTRYLQMARKWIGNDSYTLALYYTKAVYGYFSGDGKGLEQSIQYRDSLIQLANTTGLNFNDMLIHASISLCDIYFYFLEETPENIRQTWKYFNEALDYNVNIKDPLVNCNLQWLKGDLLMRDQKYDSAITVFQKMAEEASKYFLLRHQVQYTQSVAIAYESLGEKDKAIEYYKKHTYFSDSLHRMDGERMVREAREKLQGRIKQDKIESQNLVIQYVRGQRVWLIGGIILLAFLMVMLVIFYKNKRNAVRRLDLQNATLLQLNHKLEKADQTKAKLFTIISHDFRSPVNQVYQLLKLQQSKDVMIDDTEKTELEKQTRVAAFNLLESMEDLLVWSKTQMQSFNITKEYVDVYKACSQCIDLSLPLIEAKQLQLEVLLQPGSRVYTDTNFLLAILRNLLQNAVKASPEHGQLIIFNDADEHGNFRLRIMNQGPVFTQQHYTQALTNAANTLKGGLGLLIVDELSRKIGADVLFRRKGLFTCCSILFHISDKKFR